MNIFKRKPIISVLILFLGFCLIFLFSNTKEAYALCCGPGTDCGENCTQGVCPNGNDCCCNPHAPSGYGSSCSGPSITVTCGCCTNSATYYKCCTSGCPCTASCPSGSDTTNSSDHNCYAGTRSGSCTDGCGDKTTCGDGASCYSSEPNSAPIAAATLSLCVDGTCTQLSTDPLIPTRFAMPTSAQTVTLKAINTAPSGSDGLSYLYKIDNGNDIFGCDHPNDYCGTDWVTSSNSDDVRNQIGLDYGIFYNAMVHTRSKDRCDNEQKEGPVAFGYFRIDNPPTIVSVTPINLDCNSGWSGRFGVDGVDNPLDVEVTISDPDVEIFGITPAQELHRVFLALAPDETDDIGDAGCTAWEDGMKNYFLAFFDWDADGAVTVQSVSDQTKPNDPDGVNNGCPWGASNDPNFPKFEFLQASTRRSGNDLIAAFRIKFTDEFPEGQYKWFAMTDDRYNAGNCSGFYCYKEFGDWGIDHTMPSLSRTVETVGSDKVKFSWTAEDAYKGVYKIRTDLTSFPSYLSPPTAGWFGGIYSPPVSSISGVDIVKVNISDVPIEGLDISSINKVVLDRACNFDSRSSATVNWGSPWLRTLGGDVFSSGGTFNPTPIDTLEFVNYPYGYKVFSSYIYARDLNATDNLGSASEKICSYNVSPSNYWNTESSGENDVVQSQIRQIIDLVASKGTAVANIGGRVYNIHDISGVNPEYNSGIVDGLHVYYSSTDIVVQPNVINKDVLSGAIFVAEGDIVIGSGADNSEISYGTDIVEGLFVSGGDFKTLLDLGSEHPDYADALTLRGAVIAAGNVDLERNVGFTNNLTSSSEQLVYDARFIDLFRPLLGEVGNVTFRESGVQ